MTFAFLGAPRSTRHSRAVSLISALAVVAVVRGVGFIGAISGESEPSALLLPYVALVAASGLGGWGIARAVIIEPPAFLNALSESLARLVPGIAARAQ